MLENEIKIYTCQLLLAIEHLHKNNIIYRDLKPENVVLDEHGNALLTDFGLAKIGVEQVNKGAKSFCGSVAYLAPEMLSKKGNSIFIYLIIFKFKLINICIVIYL